MTKLNLKETIKVKVLDFKWGLKMIRKIDNRSFDAKTKEWTLNPFCEAECNYIEASISRRELELV